MYTPKHFEMDDLSEAHAAMRAARTATLVTATTEGLIGTPVPMLLDEAEGNFGTLYAHVARANAQWELPPTGDAMAIFNGPEAYITPSWYATKQETHRVVPTWNYIAVHAYGPVEFFDDRDRLHSVVDRLTRYHEASRTAPWNVSDAPERFVEAQLRGIVGVRIPISRIDAKSKMSQNRPAVDREGVVSGLASSDAPQDQAVSELIRRDNT
ncbi:MAG: FMN-binding negative transcriptional regulator [Pseudomonadota bacterium]